MEIHHKEIIYENRAWKVTALKHTNGTYSGKIIEKVDDNSVLWMRYPNCKQPYHIPRSVPTHIRDIIKTVIQADISGAMIL
jgi:hypothetical protein